MSLHPIATTARQHPTPSSSTGLVQPMFNTASATSDGEGNITFTFGAAFTGQILIGSFSCPSAPYTAQFTAYDNSQEVYSWQSSNNPGPLRVAENQQITVEGTGLVASTTYVMNWVGYSTVSGFAPQIVPESHSDVVLATNQGGLEQIGNFSLSGISTQAVLPTPPNGFAYRIHSINCINQTTAAVQFNLLTFFRGVVYVPFFTALVPAGNGATFLLNGLLIPTAIEGSLSPTGIGYLMNYDLIQI